MAPFSLEHLYGLEGKIAVVTGGGSGLGKHMAHCLAASGAKVYVVGRRKDSLNNTLVEFRSSYPNAKGSINPLQGDVSSKQTILELVDKFKTFETTLDILINNAGIAKGSSKPTDERDPASMQSSMLGMDPEAWTTMWDVNVVSIWYMTAAFLPLLQRTPDQIAAADGFTSSILNIASIAGYTLQRSQNAGYQASKSATIQLSRVLAGRCIPSFVRVNCICPGLFPSEMTDEDPKELQAKFGPWMQLIPLDRPGRPHEIAGPALMCCSRAGGYLNGAVIPVDGGRLLCVSAASGGSAL